MDQNLRDVLKELLNEALDNDTLYGVVREIVRDNWDYALRKALEEKAAEMVEKYATGYLEEEVKRVMNGSIRIDDGWGNTASFGSFDEFVRQKVAKELTVKWQVEEKIRNIVNPKIEKLVRAVNNNYVEALADQILGDIASGKYSGTDVEAKK